MSLPKDDSKDEPSISRQDDSDNGASNKDYKYKKSTTPGSSNIIVAIVVLAIVIVGSVLVANFIWDTAHDVSAGNVDIELISCKETGTGSTETVVKISNHNNFRVLVEWGTVGGLGYADVPAKSIITDQYYAYGTTGCGASIKSATKG